MYPTRALFMQPTRRLMMPVPKEKQSAHTISQRLRRLKSVPPELLPLAGVVGIAVVMASYAMFNKITSDKTLRLTKSSHQ